MFAGYLLKNAMNNVSQDPQRLPAPEQMKLNGSHGNEHRRFGV
jgi:hypothetical protein